MIISEREIMQICKKPTRLAATATISLLAVAVMSGCSQQDKVSFSSGGMTHTFAEGKDAVPKDFLLPIYPGATATGSVTADGGDQDQSKFLMLSTPDQMDKVSDYYQNTLKDKGWSIDKVDTDAPKVVSISVHQKDVEGNVMLADDNGKTTISLSAGKSSDTSKEDTESNSENYQPDKVNPPSD
ncbi:MAG TPA: hypothetical protein V6C81_05445 [Planktothrix sp.]|jgi:hypothetical protein